MRRLSTILGRSKNESLLRRYQATAAHNDSVRSNWTKEEIQKIYDMPLLDLVFRAAAVHRTNFNSTEVQQVNRYQHGIKASNSDYGLS